MHTFRHFRWQPLALAVFVASLAGCAAIPQDILRGAGLPGNYPDNRYPDDRDGRYGDYRSTEEYRRMGADANNYADQLDRQLDLSSMQRRGVESILESRTRDLLRQTDPRDHYRVYPFPRREAERSAEGRRWWDGTDNGIERVLNDRQRDRYRQIATSDYRGNGNYDDRYDRDDNRSGQARGAVRPNRPGDRSSSGSVRPGSSSGRGRDAVRPRGNDRSSSGSVRSGNSNGRGRDAVRPRGNDNRDDSRSRDEERRRRDRDRDRDEDRRGRGDDDDDD